MHVLATASLLLIAITGSNARNETRVLQTGATCIAPEKNVDFPGNDIINVPGASYQECCTPCYQLRECAAYTWTNYNGGTCWLKSSRSFPSVKKDPNPDGSANTVSLELVRCGHAVTSDMDLVGTEGGSARGVRPESCCHLCAGYKGCKGFAWNDYNGGTCWFKGGDVQMVYKKDVYAYIA